MDENNVGSLQELIRQEAEQVTEWICGHCIEVYEKAGREAPLHCPGCRVGYCQDCGTRQKTFSKFCHGCGRVGPEVHSRFARASSFGSVYVVRNWEKLGLGPQCTHIYGTSTGWGSNEARLAGEPIRHWIHRYSKETEYKNMEEVRELTPEERELLRRQEPVTRIE